MAVRVETEAEIPQEVADKVVEYATEAITDMAKAEENADEVIDKPNGTDAGESASAVFHRAPSVSCLFGVSRSDSN